MLEALGREARTELASEMLALEPGAHLCLVYDNAEEQIQALLPYFRQGLAAGERCTYVGDERSHQELRSCLLDAGINVEKAVRCGSLNLWGRDQWRQNGELDAASKASQLPDMIDEALKDGFKGLRFGI
jgi:hypothetical protein